MRITGGFRFAFLRRQRHLGEEIPSRLLVGRAVRWQHKIRHTQKGRSGRGPFLLVSASSTRSNGSPQITLSEMISRYAPKLGSWAAGLSPVHVPSGYTQMIRLPGRERICRLRSASGVACNPGSDYRHGFVSFFGALRWLPGQVGNVDFPVWPGLKPIDRPFIVSML
jgi:hypothetical protein